jgi:alcohol dehydrogenase
MCRPGFPSLSIPVIGIPAIAFFAVQISMNPGSRQSGRTIDEIVGSLPISFAILPKGLQEFGQAFGRAVLLEGMLKRLKVHATNIRRKSEKLYLSPMIDRLVYQMPKAGNLNNLRQLAEKLPPPAPTEVQIAVKAIGLNFADIFAMFGLYSATPQGSFIPGLEYAGEIMAVGSDVPGWKAGDLIMGVTRFGAYASHLNIDHRYVAALPEGWDFAEGAAYLVQGLTAYYALHHLGNLQTGQSVLIHSAAGGVGLLANRIAKRSGAYTIGSVGSAAKLEKLKAEGYDQGIVRGKDFPQRLRESLQGRPLDLVLECIGGKIFQQSFAQLAPMGRLVSYGSAQYASPGARPNYLRLLYYYLQRPRLDVQNLMQENKALLPFNLIHLYERAELLHELLEEMKELGLAAPFVGHRFDFAELPEALRLFQSGQTMGKVVVERKD